MKLHAVLFRGRSVSCHPRLAQVLKASAKNTPHPLVIHAVEEADQELAELAKRRTGWKQWLDNARKAKHHARIILGAGDGELLAMLDTDTMILGDLSEIERMEFDLAYTVRPRPSFPVNTGVYFVRVSECVRAFVARWYDAVRAMLADKRFHDEWKNRYGGIHQAALGYLLNRASESELQRLLAIPCETWNCCGPVWNYDALPKIVHVMGHLRYLCLHEKKQGRNERERRLVEIFRSYAC